MSALYQLDAWNKTTLRYDAVAVDDDVEILREQCKTLGLRSFRIWDVRKRADKPLPAVPRPLRLKYAYATSIGDYSSRRTFSDTHHYTEKQCTERNQHKREYHAYPL